LAAKIDVGENMRFIRIVLLSLILVTGLAACEKAQQESAELGRQAAEELKTNTLDAAQEAAALAEKSAEERAEAASQAGSE
jgi:hypothetical protein